MTRTACLWIAGLVTTTAVAQDKVDLQISAPGDRAMHYTIESKSDIKTDMQVLIDGEEFGGGGGGGRFGGRGGFGAAPSKTAIKLEFDEGKADGATWRQYGVAEATVTRAGQDGEDSTDTVQSVLSGKKVVLLEDDSGVVIREGDLEGEDLPPETGVGVPTAIALQGLAPSRAVAIDEEFDISETFRSALATLAHPIRPAGAGARGGRGGRGDAGGGQGGQRGEGGQGGQRGEGGQRGQGGRGGRGGFGRARPISDAGVAALLNDKIDCKVTGKVVAVEEKDGVLYAKVSFQGQMSGKGKPDDLGLGFAGAFGRGGRGGGQGRGQGGGQGFGEVSGKAAIEIEFQGTLLIDQSAKCLSKLELAGSLKSNSESVRTMSRGGEESEIETTMNQEGTFSLTVSCNAKSE